MNRENDTTQWLSKISLSTVFDLFRAHGAKELLYKILPQNANSKNQVYLASDLSQLGKLPTGEVHAHESVSGKNGGAEAVFRASLEFYWLDETGGAYLAPEAKLIAYPQYPEVRFSGFLRGCTKAPSNLWTKERRGTESDRILIFGVGNGQKLFGLTLPPEAPAAKEIRAGEPYDEYGLLQKLPFPDQGRSNGFQELMQRLCTIHRRGWVESTRLNRDGIMVPCNAPNCGGNTLESLLGIRSNGYALPDFQGWEIKARNVGNVMQPASTTVTLFTPEPDSGFYVTEPFAAFMARYGYPDRNGRPDRLNFGGRHVADGLKNHLTGLRMILDGYSPASGMTNANGALRLLDDADREAMAWSFAKLMEHWKIKHAHAAFVPCEAQTQPERKYRYGGDVLLGEGAEFRLVLKSIASGALFYDPGIKLEGVSTNHPTPKKRSQFRISSKNLPALYKSSRIVNVCSESGCEK
ncbi:MvaI/BcnI family restriction endonuclease [Comamonas sp. NLF-1-9]|uniref:MvaI/BcnI family restriction endonuclease n=1 Tax=Comamonas sp. NLF-1-9 TaxID=2853163 RepID=UPI001C48BE79|nr:MvaI/BcnI family restriction endonuclease [Comamonas sp. NLF-1-9]QXL84416.1 MvaI/BcnI restriction endonuclease family protein [Comamonas sp. NLF-1-9]